MKRSWQIFGSIPTGSIPGSAPRVLSYGDLRMVEVVVASPSSPHTYVRDIISMALLS